MAHPVALAKTGDAEALPVPLHRATRTTVYGHVRSFVQDEHEGAPGEAPGDGGRAGDRERLVAQVDAGARASSARRSTTMSATALHRWPSGPVTSQAWTRSAGSASGGTGVTLSSARPWPQRSRRPPRSSATRACASRWRCPPTRSSASSTRAAGAIGRELSVPGFRKGKVPPQVVIRQVGREAVLDEAVRRGLPGWYEQAVHGRRDRHRRRPQGRPRPTCPTRARRSRSRSRWACGRRPRSATRGARGGPARARGVAGRGRRPSSSACASRSPRSRPSSAPPRRATSW